MEPYHLTKYNIELFVKKLEDELEKEPILMVETKKATVGKWTLARLWRVWMSITTKWFAEQGYGLTITNKAGKYGSVIPFNAENIHEQFTIKWLGTDEDGIRLSWSKKDHDGMRAANQGERYHALRCHEEWCLGKGIDLTNPRNSEYRKLQEKERSC